MFAWDFLMLRNKHHFIISVIAINVFYCTHIGKGCGQGLVPISEKNVVINYFKKKTGMSSRKNA